ncbi:MAG: DNA-binding protein [Paramuribaculum sp.]|nr:DNA-binding protein [Paramuribaculum sp.]
MARKETTKSFLLRLDAATMARIEAWAAQEFRSVNGQLQWIIADALKRYGRTVPQQQSDTDLTKNREQED